MFAEFLTQNILWVAAFVVLANLLVLSIIQGSVRGAKMVSALELPALQRSGEEVIIDVNDAKQFSLSHIPEALNFQLSELNSDNPALMKLKDKTAIVVCQSGGRSAKAAKQLLSLGFGDVHILRGGLLSWTKENLPVTAS